VMLLTGLLDSLYLSLFSLISFALSFFGALFT
jgi:hypothetical protein